MALLVWVNLSWAGKIAQKFTLKNPLSSRSPLQVSDNFHLESSCKFFLVHSQAGIKVRVYLIQCSVFCSAALFSNAGSKTQFIFCPKICICFWMRLKTRRLGGFFNLVSFFARMGFSICTCTRWRWKCQWPCHIQLRLHKCGTWKTWHLSSSYAIVSTVLSRVLSKKFFGFFSCHFPSPCLVTVLRFKAPVVLWDDFFTHSKELVSCFLKYSIGFQIKSMPPNGKSPILL